MKGIDKKACRAFLEPLAAPSSDCGLFLIPKIELVIRTAVKIIGHRRLLVLCLYARGEAPGGRPKLTYTMFQAGDGFITFDHRPESRTHWRTAMLCNLGGSYRFAEEECAFYSCPDEQRVLDFCGSHESDGAAALYRLQKMIRDAETEQRVKRRQKKVVEEFKGLRPLPKGVDDWLRREVLPAYFYYDYHKGAKRVRGECSACGQESELEGVRHNGEGVCPCCGRKFTMKSNKKRGYIWDRETVSVVQKLRENELIVRVLKVHREHRRGEPAKAGYYEETRVVVRSDQDGRYESVPYHYDHCNCVLTHWKTGYPPICYMYGQNYSAETCGHLYCGNLKRELKGTPWEYCQLGAFYKGIQDRMEAAPYLTTYPTTPVIEYFVKLRLFWLAAQIVYRGNSKNGEKIVDLNGKNLRDVLQIDPSDLPWLQQSKSGIRDLFLLRLLHREGHRPSGELFAWLDAHNISELDCFVLALPYTTPHKLTRYLDGQLAKHDLTRYPGVGGILSEYKDYLGFCEELHYDMKNEFVLFPNLV